MPARRPPEDFRRSRRSPRRRTRRSHRPAWSRRRRPSPAAAAWAATGSVSAWALGSVSASASVLCGVGVGVGVGAGVGVGVVGFGVVGVGVGVGSGFGFVLVPIGFAVGVLGLSVGFAAGVACCREVEFAFVGVSPTATTWTTWTRWTPLVPRFGGEILAPLSRLPRWGARLERRPAHADRLRVGRSRLGRRAVAADRKRRGRDRERRDERHYEGSTHDHCADKRGLRLHGRASPTPSANHALRRADGPTSAAEVSVVCGVEVVISGPTSGRRARNGRCRALSERGVEVECGQNAGQSSSLSRFRQGAAPVGRAPGVSHSLRPIL